MADKLDMVIKITECDDECPFSTSYIINRARCSCCYEPEEVYLCSATDLEFSEGAKEKCPLKNGRIIVELKQ